MNSPDDTASKAPKTDRERTPQENLWAGEFGTDYVTRNRDVELIENNVALFRKVLDASGGEPSSIIEFGANIGNNLKALRRLLPEAQIHSIEINAEAADQITQWGGATVEVGSIVDVDLAESSADLTFTKGVLIHLAPEVLPAVYDRLVNTSRRWIMVCEYYNPVPVEVSYRGHEHALFKRDFAGEILDHFPDLRLVDYGFTYHRDTQNPLDDSTWFLLEKPVN